MLKQIYCTEGTTCASVPLEKRKIIKKIFFDTVIVTNVSRSGAAGPTYRTSGSIFALLYSAIFMWLFSTFVKRAINLDHVPTIVQMVLSLWFWPLIIFLSLLWSLVYQIFYYRNYFYDIKNDGIIIRKGFIARQEITIDYRKIQNVFVDQDFFDRLFGLYDVHIATADFQSADIAHIDGVNATNAEVLKSEIIKQVNLVNNQTVSSGL